MSDLAPPSMTPATVRSPLARLALWLGPLILFLAVLVGIAAMDPLRGFGSGAPPVEAITFERTVLDGEGIALLVRAGGSEPMVIA